MALKKKGKQGVKLQASDIGLPEIAAVEKANENAYAGEVLAKFSGKKEELRVDFKDIQLVDIELNPDNALFRENDDEEGIRLLAEDIQRNGLLHNLVVFPRQDGKRTKYVLLSGERRYRALNYLQKQGDAKWNTVKNCRVIVTELSENEKKVLLYSANLQVRGGFGDEMIRRKAIAEFVACLQKEPFNLSEAAATAAVKELSPQNTRTMNKDIRIEKYLHPVLKQLLDEKFIIRSEAEAYLRLTGAEAEVAAEKLSALSKVDCHGEQSGPDQEKNYLEIMRDKIHREFREALGYVMALNSLEEAKQYLQDAQVSFNAELAELEQASQAYGKAEAAGDSSSLKEKEQEARVQAAKEKDARKQSVTKGNAIQQSVPKCRDKLKKMLENKRTKSKIAQQTPESREEDIRSLQEMIEVATKLKKLIESVE